MGILNLGWVGAKDASKERESEDLKTVVGAPSGCAKLHDQEKDVWLVCLFVGLALLTIGAILFVTRAIQKKEAAFAKQQDVVNILRQPSRPTSTLATSSKWRIAQKGMSSMEIDNST